MTDRHPDCRCRRAVHVHGSRTTYVVHKCRCDACRADSTLQARKRNRLKAYGRHHLMDAEPVRAHLRGLMAQGMGWKRIAHAAGLSASTVYSILYGKLLDQPAHPEHRPPRKRVARHVGEALLAVTLDVADAVPVDATGTVRRIRALIAIGWPIRRLAAELGIKQSNFRLHKDVERVHEATRKAVADLYERVWDAEPPCANRHERRGVTMAKRYAAARGWAPPMAWDDDTIDDPAAQPDMGADFTSRSERVAAESAEALWLLDVGEDLESVARRFGISPQGLTLRLRRVEPDWRAAA